MIALGGGVIGDLSGFVAASYMRGIAFYQIPTNVLSMVDSSIGGKTGINLPEGKNLVGAFWQPQAVFMDMQTLRSLPESEFRQGAVELFKHGLLADPSILADVESPEFHPKGNAEFLQDIIKRSVQVKANIVAIDEKEQNIRAYLNLGHTLAHALEAASDHQLSHGEAVAYGLVFDAHLSKQRGYADETERLLKFLRWMKPKPLGISDLSELEPYMLRDKKNEAGKVKFVILKKIGEPVMVDDVTLEERERAWAFLQYYHLKFRDLSVLHSKRQHWKQHLITESRLFMSHPFFRQQALTIFGILLFFIAGCSMDTSERDLETLGLKSSYARQFGSISNDETTGIATDSNGNIYVAVNTHTSVEQAYIYKYDAAGNFIESKSPTGAPCCGYWYTYIKGITGDKNGNVYVTGDFTDYSLRPEYAYVDKYDSSGTLVWTKKFTDTTVSYLGDPTPIRTNAISTDARGNVYIMVERAPWPYQTRNVSIRKYSPLRRIFMGENAG